MVKLNCCCCCCCWTTHLVTYRLYKNIRILPQYIFTASWSLCFRNSTYGWRSGYKWNGKNMKSLFNKRRWIESNLIPHTGLVIKVIPVKLFLDHFPPSSEVSWSRNSQSCGVRFTHVASPSSFTRKFYPSRNYPRQRTK